MKLVWLNKVYIFKIATTIICTIYSFAGFIGMFVPFDEILSSTLRFLDKMFISIGILILLWGIVFIVVAIILIKKRRFIVIVANNGHNLYLQYGDLFDENIVINPSERRNIVIPVNCCFDTAVNNTLISEHTLHGRTFNELYKKKLHTPDTLNTTIQKLLENKEYEVISQIEKPVGNLKRFPVGTVVDLPSDNNVHYFLLALSTFDSELKAQTNMNDYTTAMQKIVEACNIESEGFPVVLPIIGTGLSRTKKEQNDVISYMVNIFKINRNEINSDIHIVVREDIKNTVAIMNIK